MSPAECKERGGEGWEVLFLCHQAEIPAGKAPGVTPFVWELKLFPCSSILPGLDKWQPCCSSTMAWWICLASLLPAGNRKRIWCLIIYACVILDKLVWIPFSLIASLGLKRSLDRSMEKCFHDYYSWWRDLTFLRSRGPLGWEEPLGYIRPTFLHGKHLSRDSSL